MQYENGTIENQYKHPIIIVESTTAEGGAQK